MILASPCPGSVHHLMTNVKLSNASFQEIKKTLARAQMKVTLSVVLEASSAAATALEDVRYFSLNDT